jgi:hypothetical protein
MSAKKIYGKKGELIAERVSESCRITLYAVDGSYIGEYIKDDDMTYDNTGTFVGYGDLLTTLIRPC